MDKENSDREEVWGSRSMIMWAISSKQKKGLRQGDPLSPIVFNLVANMLALLVSRAREDNQIKGVVPHLVDGGLSIHWNM